MSVAEKLTEIAENVPKVYEAGYQAGCSASGERDDSIYANALKGTATGDSVVLDDASPFVRTAKVKLKSKNIHESLVDYLFYDDSEDENVTITETDGHPTINGTYTHNDYNDGYIGDSADIAFEGGKTYTVSVKRFGGEIADGAVDMSMSILSDDGEYSLTIDMRITSDRPEGALQSFVVPWNGLGYTTFTVEDGTVFDNFTFEVQVEEGATATAYTPIVADPTAATVVMRGGKNLFDPSVIPEEYAYNGVVLNRNGDEISLSFGGCDDEDVVTGSMLNDYNCCLALPDMVGEEFVLTFYGTVEIGDQVVPSITTSDRQDGGFEHLRCTANGIGKMYVLKFRLDKPYLRLTLALDAATAFNDSFTIQLERGNSWTEYEPYAPKTYPVAEDGTCEIPVEPNCFITTDTPGVALECEYAQDTNKVIEKLVNAIISMGGNV